LHGGNERRPIQATLLKKMNAKIKYFIAIMMVLTITIISSRLYVSVARRSFSGLIELGPDFFALSMQIIIYKLNAKKISTKFAKYLWPILLVMGILGLTTYIYYANILFKYSYFRSKGLMFFGYPLSYDVSLIIYSLLMKYLYKKLNCKVNLRAN
jgi:hypothetical protein